MDTDEFQLSRFLIAQEASYATALAEIRSGSKRTHWIWFVFPQIRGLGASAMADAYGLSCLSEARRYLAHPVLGRRLHESVEAMLRHHESSAEAVLGELDARKFRSCLTLFSCVAPADLVFSAALQRFFRGNPDARTLALLDGTRGG